MKNFIEISVDETYKIGSADNSTTIICEISEDMRIEENRELDWKS